jgi:hypothetical protein
VSEHEVAGSTKQAAWLVAGVVMVNVRTPAGVHDVPADGAASCLTDKLIAEPVRRCSVPTKPMTLLLVHGQALPSLSTLGLGLLLMGFVPPVISQRLSIFL